MPPLVSALDFDKLLSMSTVGDLRRRYEAAVLELRTRVAEMRSDGQSPEMIARVICAERRRLTARFKEQTPEPWRSRIYKRTLTTYGDAIGPTVESLRAQGKSWEQIIESATRPGRWSCFDSENALV